MAEVVETTVSIVIVGQFNPLIFQPEWLAAQGIIGAKEAEKARDGGIDFIHPEVTSFRLGFGKVVVERQRMVVTAANEPFVVIKDFTSSCLKLLPHIPCVALGFNLHTTIREPDDAKWNRLGDLLAPKAPWSDLLEGEQRIGGLRSMVMERSQRRDGRPGYMRVTFEVLESEHPDAKISVNDHYKLLADGKAADGLAAFEIIDAEWDGSLATAKLLTDSILKTAANA